MDKSQELVLLSARSQNKKLSDMELRFCEEYVKTYNASEAYRTVKGFKKSDTTQKVRIAAWRLLQRSDIREYIEILKANLSELSMISRFKVLDEYSKIAFANMGKFHKTWMEVQEFEKLTPEEKAVISEVKVTYKDEYKGGKLVKSTPIITFKLHDKIRALDSIARMLGYEAPTKIQMEGVVPAPPTINVYQGETPPLASREEDVKDV